MEDTRIGFITANKLREVAPEIISDKGWYKEAGSIFKHGGALLLNTAFEEVPDLGYAPTQSLLQKWFRDKHNILIDICTYYKEDDLPLNSPRKHEGYFCWDPYNEEFYEELAPKFKTYEEALEFGLQEALDMLKSIDSVNYD